jgi:hypothetical protein
MTIRDFHSTRRRALLAPLGTGLGTLAAARIAPETTANAGTPASFPSRYRGIVTDNKDPLRTARLKVNVPAVGGDLGWVAPSVPYAGSGRGLYAIPPIGANVWVEFEQGDANYPVWTGGYWGSSAEVPGGGDPALVALAAPGGTVSIHDEGGIAIVSNHIVLRGPVEFARSGVLVIRAGRVAAAQTEASIAARSVVLATIQGIASGISIASVVTQPGKGFTVHLTMPAPRPVRVGWLAIERP